MFKIFKKNNADTQKDKFNLMLEFAQSVINSAEKSEKFNYSNKNNVISNTKLNPLLDVIRLLGKKKQTEHLIDLLYVKDESSLLKVTPEDVFFDPRVIITNDGKCMNDLLKPIKSDIRINLKSDLILPCPWKRTRLINTISSIGEGKISEKWEQDYNNHYVDVWLPLRIAWVNGGNHSIASGIIQGVGEIKPENVYDISSVYDYVYTDGINYISKIDGGIISSVKNLEFAVIFEIGRMINSKL